MTLTPGPDMNTHALYDDARLKRKTVSALPPYQQPGDETSSEGNPYHVSLGMLIAHELPPKWMENKVLHLLRGEVKHPHFIKPNKLSRINNLVSAFSTFFIPFLPKVTPDNYLATPLKQSYIVNQKLINAAQQIQQHKDLLTKFEEE